MPIQIAHLYIGQTVRTSWQAEWGMKWILAKIEGDKGYLVKILDRNKGFWTDLKDIRISGERLIHPPYSSTWSDEQRIELKKELATVGLIY